MAPTAARDGFRWHRAVEAGSLSSGRGRAAQLDGRWIAVVQDGDEYFATDDACPHQGAPLSEGIVLHGLVICPWHSWAFDVRSGRCARAPHVGIATYAARRRGEWIEVELPDGPSAADGVPNESSARP